ncbi:MAG: HAD family phosphatase [Bacillota bacterium]|nr:HAD family phosphatase [Bacillota bacterium]
MIKGIILDLDGLISDTERLHMKAFQQAFKEKGMEISDDFYKKHWIQIGHGTEDVLKILGSDISADAIRAIKNVYYEDYLHTDLYPMAYVHDFVEHFYGKIPMAVASASKGFDVEFILKALDLERYMEFFLSADDVKKRKPDPEVWLLAAKKLGLDPEDCITLEDAEKGVIASYRAGIPCIAIPNSYTADNDFSKATYMAKDLKEARDLIENILNK